MRNSTLLCVVLPALIAPALTAQVSPVHEDTGLHGRYMQAQGAPHRSSSGTIPSFTSSILNVPTAEAFEAFIEKHRGKLVHLNVKVGSSFSKMDGENDGQTDFFVSTEPCGEDTSSLDCVGAHYMITGRGFVLRKYGSMNMLIGYFLVDEDVEMHQGTCYGLQAVPALKALFRN